MRSAPDLILSATITSNNPVIAVGLKPFGEIPTARNAVSDENVEGGLVIPFAIILTEKIEAELTTEYDNKNNLGSEYFNSGSLTYQWNSIVSTYMETATILRGDDSPARS